MSDIPLLDVKHISVTLGGKKILTDVSITMHPGDIKVLIGPSGAGKSTFLQCINQLIKSDEGDIYLEGNRMDLSSGKDLCVLRQTVGMIFQDFNLFDHLTAVENVALALRKVRGMTRKEADQRARAELDRVGLLSRAHLYPAELSGGQKQRVAIARAIAMDPKVLLLDEPTSALDPELVGEVVAVIRDLASGGMPMIMATHQMDLVRNVAHEVLFMESGRIVEQASPKVLLAPGSKSRTLDFCTSIFDLGGDAEDGGKSA